MWTNSSVILSRCRWTRSLHAVRRFRRQLISGICVEVSCCWRRQKFGRSRLPVRKRLGLAGLSCRRSHHAREIILLVCLLNLVDPLFRAISDVGAASHRSNQKQDQQCRRDHNDFEKFASGLRRRLCARGHYSTHRFHCRKCVDATRQNRSATFFAELSPSSQWSAAPGTAPTLHRLGMTPACARRTWCRKPAPPPALIHSSHRRCSFPLLVRLILRAIFR